MEHFAPSPKRVSSEPQYRPQSSSIPEAQFHNDFYAACCEYGDNKSLVSFPKFGTQKGRIDFEGIPFLFQTKGGTVYHVAKNIVDSDETIVAFKA